MRVSDGSSDVCSSELFGDGGGEMRLARQQNVFGTAGQVSLVLLGQRGDGEGVPAEGVGVGKVCAHARANRPDPSEIKARTNNGKWPKLFNWHCKSIFGNNRARR